MNPSLVGIDDAVARLGSFGAVIDVRSPAEFAEDHLPGAVNWPVLDDDERRIVGTLYKQASALEARKVGAVLVARRIAGHLDTQLPELPREWAPLVYCWRGGQRSGTLAWFLAQIGFRTSQLQGGYKGFRRFVRADLDKLPLRLQFNVICGRTGSGKTRLLQALAQAGAQVLDLEGLACHRGSVLGGLPDQPQPSQKRFDTLVWQALAGFDPARPVFVESESARIGALQVPHALLQCYRDHGHCISIEVSAEERVRMLMEDYAFFAADPERFCGLLESLVEHCGRVTVAQWQAAARAGRWAEVFADLMVRHYDPLYEHSMAHNFQRLAAAQAVRLVGAQAMPALARRLAQQVAPPPPGDLDQALAADPR